MSLRVWLPLTKDLRQQGLDNWVFSSYGTVTQPNTGKLGNCLQTGATGTVYNNNISLTLNGNFSIGYWLRIDAYQTSWNNFFTLDYDGNHWCGMCYNNSSNGSAIGWHVRVDINGTATNIFDRYVFTGLTVGQWYHIGLTMENGTTCKMYLNGALIYTGNTSATYPMTTYTRLILGSKNYNNSYSNCSINDFRVYDHTLSQKEVKELAKGLVLHYPLNRGGWGQENFYTGNGISALSNTSSVSNNGYESTFVLSAQGGVRASNLGFNGKTGPWTASFDIKSSVNTTITIDICDRGYNTATYGTSLTKDVWTHKSFIVTTATNQYNVSGNYNGFIDFNCGAAGTYNIRNLKVEEGTIETPWCPASSSVLGQSMGLNSTTEYDCSGFCNNGTKVGTLGWSSNTPKYNVSLDVTTDSCARYIYGPAQTQLTNQITLACWLYQTLATATSGGSSTTNQFALSQGRDYLNLGFNITVNNGKPGVYAGNGGSESGARVSLISTTKTITGSWHHVAATYNNGALKLYVDGQLDRETTIGALDYVDAPALVVGKMAYGYTNTSSYFPFVGYISDVRVYATALSADDVLSLYQNSAYIDSSGNVYGAVHTEV